MKIFHDFSLRSFNTFGVEATAHKAVQLDSPGDLSHQATPAFNPATDLVLGGGSNILFAADVEGTVFLNRILGKHIAGQDSETVLVDVAAGENWHSFVTWCVQQGFHGLENLSLIPGLAGAAPIQNIGAYGVELAELLDSVEVFDWSRGEILRITSADCGFAYRDSRFKSVEPGRFLVLSCRLRLAKKFTPNTRYAGLADELQDMGIQNPNARQLSDAVMRIRRRKLPDPVEIGNAGSFFKNPVVPSASAEALKTSYAELPIYSIDADSAKLSAAWLIEQCGWKGSRDGDAGISSSHALVLVNHGTASGMDLLELARRVADSVHERFGIHLEHEPQIFGHLF